MIMRHPRKILVALVSAAALTAFATYQNLAGNKPLSPLTGPTKVDVKARPIPLNSENPTMKNVGQLRYLAGWSLTADNENFGGFSGLVVDETNLTAISDRGDWLSAVVDWSQKAPLITANMRPFDSQAQDQSKRGLDAESLIRLDDGYLVSFESYHRLLTVTAGGKVALARQSMNLDFSGVAANGGVEAIAPVTDGVLLLVERGLDTQGRLRGWVVREDRADDIYFKPPLNFFPTDAATLKNGDVLVLLRRFSLLSGVAAKLVRIRAGDIQPGATLVGEELTHLEPPLAVDNMEGLDVIEREGQPTRIVMISDDNFRASQRTLLLVFSLEAMRP